MRPSGRNEGLIVVVVVVDEFCNFAILFIIYYGGGQFIDGNKETGGIEVAIEDS
jgi:hypothetical protein